MQVQQLPEWANTNAVSINDVIQVKLYELYTFHTYLAMC